MSHNQPGNLEEQVVELRNRVNRLEATLRSLIALQPAPEPPPQIPPPPRPTPEAIAPIPPFLPTFTTPTHPAPEQSLESRIGSQWFNRIGILAVLIGMALFLKLAIDNHWIGPLGRVLIGLAAGVGFIIWSERFQRQGYKPFAYSLKAVGSGILYLSLWAAFSLFHLLPAAVAFAAMVLVTAFNAFMAWTEDAELLAVYSIAGGLSTPLLVSTGGNHELSLFTYLFILDLAVLILVILRPWSRLLFGAFTCTVLFFCSWSLAFYTDSQLTRTALFTALFFLLFAFAPRLIRLPAASTSRWDSLAGVLMPITNAAFGFLTFHALFDRPSTQWSAPWLAVAFAAFYLLLTHLPAQGILLSGTQLLADIHLTLAVVFLAIAIPLKAHGRWLTIGWLVQGAALLWVAHRLASQLLRALALLCLALGLAALFLIHPPASTTPFLNERFATYCVAIALLAAITRLPSASEDNPEDPLSWPLIAAGSILLVNILTLTALSFEIHNYWWFTHWTGRPQLLHDHMVYAQFTYSALFMAYGAALLAVGLWQKSAFIRWQALILVAIAIAKVFLVDVRELSQGYSILSFLGLGALLLGVSFVYQRDYLHLRHPDGPTA